MQKKLKVKKHSATATLPERKSTLAAGYDLCSDEEVTIPPGQRKTLETNISVEVPPGHYGRIAPRSGLAVKQGINVMAGVIDADYRGEIGVILANLGQETFVVERGMRIAQMVVAPVSQVSWNAVEALDDSERGAGGFGSTGTTGG